MIEDLTKEMPNDTQVHVFTQDEEDGIVVCQTSTKIIKN